MTLPERSIGDFLSTVASRQVTPSGGAVAAVTGAMGAALGEMVCIHTDESTVTADTAATLREARTEIEASRERLLELAAEDMAAIDEVQTVFEVETDADHEEAALKRATTIPLEIAETCAEILDRAVVVAEHGNPNAHADAVASAHIARAALASTAAIVRTNVGLLDDRAFVADVTDRITTAENAADRSLSAVQSA